mmetsp:Transcript_22392/g.47284  ORF Transcript_22392/g.47284 Transcript_22392/m.47284 type:complete len:97 (+) Transcript_22392:3115-3405(+)
MLRTADERPPPSPGAVVSCGSGSCFLREKAVVVLPKGSVDAPTQRGVVKAVEDSTDRMAASRRAPRGIPARFRMPSLDDDDQTDCFLRIVVGPELW